MGAASQQTSFSNAPMGSIRACLLFSLRIRGYELVQDIQGGNVMSCGEEEMPLDKCIAFLSTARWRLAAAESLAVGELQLDAHVWFHPTRPYPPDLLALLG